MIIKLTLRAIFFVLALVSSTLATAQIEPPFVLPDKQELTKLRSAVLMTEFGDLVFELFPLETPCMSLT